MISCVLWLVAPGSSPRMRGKLTSQIIQAREAGLIPAHAGKTQRRNPVRIPFPAHPRACGENFIFFPNSKSRGGSSPRMRGKQLSGRGHERRGGLIPAHAGKTFRRGTVLRTARAHPRACGENTERSGVLALRSVRSWKTLSFPSSLKVTHCRAFVQLPFSRIRL